MAEEKEKPYEAYCYLVTTSAGIYMREWLAIKGSIKRKGSSVEFKELHTDRPVIICGNFFLEPLNQSEYYNITQSGLYDRPCKDCD